MKFIVTSHANKRILERDLLPLPDLEKINFKRITRGLKKKIRNSCKNEGCDTVNSIYFSFLHKSKTVVFVSKPTETVGEFILITVLTYNNSK